MKSWEEIKAERQQQSKGKKQAKSFLNLQVR